MANKTVEIHVSEDVYALVKKMAEAGRGKGRGARVPCTIGEMAADLVSTGAHRRIAANKWAKENAPEPKAKKVKAPKVAKVKKPKVAKKIKAVKAPKAKKVKAPKVAKVKKPKAAKKIKTVKAPKAKPATPAPASAAAVPAPDPLS